MGKVARGTDAGAARSFKQHGFRHVFFLGDHGGYQKSEQRVAARLDREWARDPTCRVHALLDYYQATQGAYVVALKQRGFGQAEIGIHAGLADTSLSLAVDQSLVRGVMLKEMAKPGANSGVSGDPRGAKIAARLRKLGAAKRDVRARDLSPMLATPGPAIPAAPGGRRSSPAIDR